MPANCLRSKRRSTDSLMPTPRLHLPTTGSSAGFFLGRLTGLSIKYWNDSSAYTCRPPSSRSSLTTLSTSGVGRLPLLVHAS
jgi:hypothetical protein